MGTTVGHILLDGQGRNLSNGMDVGGQGRTTYQPGEPAPIRRADGSVAATMTVRPDGGLDIDPGAGHVYSIVSRGGDPSSGMEYGATARRGSGSRASTTSRPESCR